MTESTHHPAEDLWDDLWNDSDREEVLKLRGPIWIIGASGFIGAKLVASLLKIRKDVVAISSNLEGGWRGIHLPDGARLNLDITKADEVSRLVRAQRPQTVFNLAAYGAYERQSHALQIHQVNYLGCLHLLLALRETGCAAFVQAGSSSEYGLNCSAPSEDAGLEPNSDYAVSKAAVSHLLWFYGRLRGVPCCHLRLYSVYGPWEERDRLVPRLIASGLDGGYPTLVRPEISRDFLYVDDCTRAFVKAAAVGCVAHPGETFNIATGTETTIGEIAALVGKLSGLDRAPVFGAMPNRSWDLSRWYGDPSKARSKLNWEARTSLLDGLVHTQNWERRVGSLLKFAPPPKKPEKLSAIIACYRDHEAIPIMHSRLTAAFRGLGVDYEILFINDNSPTEDEKQIKALCEVDSHVIGVSHSRNFGSQSAFLSGMEIATGDAVILLDGDLQDPPEVIPAFFKEWKEGFDVVYGERVRREASWYMQVLYKVFYRLFRYLSNVPIPLDAGDFSMIDRKVVDHLLELPERDIFLRGLRAWVGFRQTGVPYNRPERMFGKSTNSFLKNIWWAKKAIFSFSTKPLQYIQGLGLLVFLFSIALSLFYTVFHFLHPDPGARGITTIAVLVLALGGLQIFSLSILGDYVAKILEESKHRPLFIRSRILRGSDCIQRADAIDAFVKERHPSVSRRPN